MEHKLACIFFGHSFETKLIKGHKTVNLGDYKHVYETIVDVKLVCKRCGQIVDRKSWNNG